eukprot:CAMPEP_0175802222 /NCGR_PEP_ID=MMETSP0097-20121207/87931_1 /TAXON_ID=311494 /ORGANISM="Alexandrium monilatum, Strain CCMP3105" /LENGTH=525 /DNA_ID=CAMNT_0017113555 /DNA_START=193 /DNA_END=1767 /DNA_ORIENTATION=-
MAPPSAVPPPTASHGHFHCDLSVWVVAEQLEVGSLEAVDVLDVRVHAQHGEGPGGPLELRLQGLHVVLVDVRVARGVDEVTGPESADLRHHARQQGVGGDVEGHAQAHVAGPLVHEAGQLPVGHVELAEHVAGRQRHEAQVRRVPGGQQDPSVGGVLLDLPDALRQLVDALPCVVLVHVHVLRAEVPPLEAVDGPQVALLAVGETPPVQEFAGAVGVPDLHPPLGQVLRVRVPPDEPEKLLDDSAPEGALRGQQGEAPPEVEAHLPAEDREGAHARAVVHGHALLDDLPDGLEVLVLLMQELLRAARGRQRGRGRAACRRRPLVDHEVVGHALVAPRLAHVHDPELPGVEGREKGVGLHVPSHARDEDALARLHADCLLVGGLPSDHKDLRDVLARAEGLCGRLEGGCDQHARGVGRDEAGLRGRLRQHDVDAANQRPELFGDGLPGPPAHDHGVGPLAAGRGGGHALEVGEVLRDVPGQFPILADASVLSGGHDDGNCLQGHHSLGPRERGCYGCVCGQLRAWT